MTFHLLASYSLIAASNAVLFFFISKHPLNIAQGTNLILGKLSVMHVLETPLLVINPKPLWPHPPCTSASSRFLQFAAEMSAIMHISNLPFRHVSAAKVYPAPSLLFPYLSDLAPAIPRISHLFQP
jgi:hypothetical protein